jgi:hypothetical protein
VLASSNPAENGFEDFETVSTPVSDTSARGILLVDVDTASDTDELCCSVFTNLLLTKRLMHLLPHID